VKRDKAWSCAAIGITVLGLLIAGYFLAQSAGTGEDPDAVNVKVQMEGYKDFAHLSLNPDGTHRYVLSKFDGGTESLTAEQFAERLYRQQKSRRLWEVIFNISSPMGFIWVSIGLLGQVLFTGRMIVQWLVSEKSKQSVVPAIFWWMSLTGAMMLLAYFLWRRDVVGILGQSVGLGIYVRNLHFIYIAKRTHGADSQPVSD
jgi:lipid-A-disaccharide synthase-like uncharacterized protein